MYMFQLFTKRVLQRGFYKLYIYKLKKRKTEEEKGSSSIVIKIRDQNSQNLSLQNLGNKQLQYTYYPNSQELKTIRQ